MRNETEQIEHILSAVEKINTIIVQSVTKEQLTGEIARWCQMVAKKTNDMKDKNNYIDYEFYSLMNYIEMVPEEIILYLFFENIKISGAM